jgi:carbonic anhydrase
MPFPQQSPINIRNPYPANLGDRGLDVRYRGKVSGLVVKEKEGAKVQLPWPYTQHARVGKEKYDLVSFHFHHLSEHLIDGKTSDIELHLVHSLVEDGIRYLVIAVMIDFDETAPDPHEKQHTFFHAVATILKFEDVEGLSPGERSVTFEPNYLLPHAPEKQPYYYYEGSLTTPEFDETVSWVVMPPITMKRSYFEELGLLRHIEKPARPPQPSYRRIILLNSASVSTPSESEHVAATQKSTPKRAVKKQG